ncbi:MAG: SET domain-containing protein-lysine N-methyltransferase [Bryobacteraceae bacterium]
MKVCVLQPDYRDSKVDYRNYDPPRDLSALLLGDQVDHLFLHKATTYRQLREASRRGYDIFVNLCEGYLDWDVPSIDVIWSLDRLGLPYTGSSARLYDPSKELMKYVAHTRGVQVPKFACEVETALAQLYFPMFVKPAHAGDSLGVDADSLCHTPEQVRAKADAIVSEYGAVMIEEFIDGREFTVLVAENAENRFEPLTFQPIEFLFPRGEYFKTYELKVQTHHPESNVAVEDAALAARLREAARTIFIGFEGEGYARLDFRLDTKGLWFLDINFACSVFYPPGYEGSADYILRSDPAGHRGFLRHVIEAGLARHRRKEPRFVRGANGIAGFGIYATCELKRGEIVFRGEERATRLATRTHIMKSWPPDQVEIFRQYAVLAGNEVFMLWDEDPREWAPQNHSCDPNTGYSGLNLLALRDIRRGEELTIDYGGFGRPDAVAFTCSCGAGNCRGRV